MSGAKLAAVGNRLREYLAINEYPYTIILYLGSNDIFNDNLGDIGACVAAKIMAF